MRKRLKVEVRGAVQGVGFRPFVYRLAGELELPGWVLNDVTGVSIEVDGEQAVLERFLERLTSETPPSASVQSTAVEWNEPAGYRRFEIRTSEGAGRKAVQVLPEVATCLDCRNDVLDPDNRRHLYPFTNCTQCGPRFSIVLSLPYDRPNTTMARFEMCPACRGEYEDPTSRRFHAQPNACPECGPSLALWDRSGTELAVREDALEKTVKALEEGRIIAAKGLGGFHLMVDARNGEAVARLRAAKPRREKPLAVMAGGLEEARSLCRVDEKEADVLASPEAPIVLLPRLPSSPVDDGVAPGNPYLGVMLPYTPLHHLLLAGTGFPLVATSGNLSDEPICFREDEAAGRLSGIADFHLVHDRPIARHVDDSVAYFQDGELRLIRRARGYAPRPVVLGAELPTILAAGAHLKNVVALSVGSQAFLSQHIGDMDTPESMAAFESVIGDFLDLYEAEPEFIAHDLHPDYASTRWAREWAAARGVPTVAVQHHHAHLASCLADNGIEGETLGVIWDGTGYGTDATIWGGEFLLGDASHYRRVAHLRPFRLPGGEKAIREPRRTALALLREATGDSFLSREDLLPVRSFRPAERRLVGEMLDKGVNSPVTTSAGRLFDGFAALAGLHPVTSFEAQAAMALEYAVDPGEDGSYPFVLESQGADDPADTAVPMQVDWRPAVVALLDDLAREIPLGVIAARFHNMLVESIVCVAKRIGRARIAISGGCFQNRILTQRVLDRLRSERFEVLLQRRVPANDGGICLGQVAVAAAVHGPGKQIERRAHVPRRSR